MTYNVFSGTLNPTHSLMQPRTDTQTDRQTDRHTDACDHITFRVVYDSREM